MKNIPGIQITDSNVGSLRDILFVSVDDVSSILEPTLDAQNGEVYPSDCLQGYEDAVTGATTYKLDCTNYSGKYSYKQIKNPNGPRFDIEITAEVPKDYIYRPNTFKGMQEDRFFVITRDMNGKVRLHGYMNKQGERYGLQFTEDFSTGNVGGAKSGYVAKFFMNNSPRPLVMEDLVDVIIGSGIPVDTGGVGDPAEVPPDLGI